jgi:hypothetical protein
MAVAGFDTEEHGSQTWWCGPVVSATWETEAGESLEPRSLRTP